MRGGAMQYWQRAAGGSLAEWRKEAVSLGCHEASLRRYSACRAIRFPFLFHDILNIAVTPLPPGYEMVDISDYDASPRFLVFSVFTFSTGRGV